MVESTALEMRRGGNSTVGSNPTLSAIYFLNNSTANPSNHTSLCPMNHARRQHERVVIRSPYL